MVKTENDIREEKSGNALIIPLCLLALLLAFSYPLIFKPGVIKIIEDLCIIYLYLLFAGLGWYFLVTPRPIRSPLLLPFLSPLCTMAVFSIVNVYVMYFNLNVVYTLYGSLIAGAGALLLALLLERRNILEHLAQARQSTPVLLPLLFSTILVVLIVLTPTLRAGFPTTPYRLNIDQAGYAEAGQFLHEGGTVKKAAEEIARETGASDVRKAVKSLDSALKANTWVDAIFLVKSGTRNGYLSMLSTYALITKSRHVLQVQFLSLAISYGLLFGILFGCLFLLMGLTNGLALSISAAMALNANLLDVYYEGLNAQIFFMPFLVVLFFEYGLVRKSGPLRAPCDGFPGSVYGYDVRHVLFLSLLLSAMLNLYAEGVMMVLALFAICLALDCLFKRRVDLPSTILPLSAAALTCVLISPQIHQYLNWSLGFFSERSVGGFWQPHWAYPAEIVGIFNMYTAPYTDGGVPRLLRRSGFNTFFNEILSIVLLFFVVSYLWRRKDLDRTLWLAPPLFVLAVFLETRYISGIHNYMYTKAFTMLLPFLLVTALGAIGFFIKTGGRLMKRMATYLMYFAFISIALSGLFFIQEYGRSGRIVTKEMLDLYRYNVNNDNLFDSYAFLTNRADVTEFMLIPLVPLRWLNQGIKKNVVPHLDKTVAVFVRKDVLRDSSTIENHRKDIIYENPSFAVLSTGQKLAAFYNPATGTCDVSLFLGKYKDLF